LKFSPPKTFPELEDEVFQDRYSFYRVFLAIAHPIPNKISATRMFAQNNQVSHVSEHKWPQMAHGDGWSVEINSHNFENTRAPKSQVKKDWPQIVHSDGWKVPLKSRNFQNTPGPKPDYKEERIKSLVNKTSATRILSQNNKALHYETSERRGNKIAPPQVSAQDKAHQRPQYEPTVEKYQSCLIQPRT
jgi:hypothetical protein